MTIALGMLSAGGIVLAADTEITAGEAKGEGHKIPYWWEVDENATCTGGMAITGAGDTGCLEVISGELFRLFASHREASMNELENLFRTHLKRFYKDHILPFGSRPEDRPEIWLIIAAQRDGVSKMWKTVRNTIRPAPTFAVVGLGDVHGEALLKTFDLPTHVTGIGQLIAAYVVFQVKKSTGFVGQDTDLIVFDGTGPNLGFDREAVRGFEEVFRTFSDIEARLFHSIIGSPYYTAEKVRADIQDLQAKFDRTLERHALGEFSREVLSKLRWSKHDPSDPQPLPE